MESQKNKGKPVTTSVPSISIKFNANVEQLEDFYMTTSDDDNSVSELSTASAGAAENGFVSGLAPILPKFEIVTSESDSSPLKYLPKLVKRSTSIDITPTSHKNQTDASPPPSDPWRFFSDIKGKITKSVEEKITEIKTRNLEEGSPLKSRTVTTVTTTATAAAAATAIIIVKDSKDNSSVSDSEELSESSISKTCGLVSTTEGAEMSSDEDTPSLERDKKSTTDNNNKKKAATSSSTATSSLRNRFRLLKPKTNKETTITKSGLAKLYNINAERIEQTVPEEDDNDTNTDKNRNTENALDQDNDLIESGVDALEDVNLIDETKRQREHEDNEKLLNNLENIFDNIDIDNADGIITINEVSGRDIRQMQSSQSGGARPSTVFAPLGFVDMRTKADEGSFNYWPGFTIGVLLVAYFCVQMYSKYMAGFIAGALITYTLISIKTALTSPTSPIVTAPIAGNILEIPAVKEYQPLRKFEGWMNEFPEIYNPHTYHINQTQSVYLRLQGNLLRVSHSRSKIPKRALWNEPNIKPTFTHHRIYNLLGARIAILPQGLAKKRHWSKKYPICITLNKDQVQFEAGSSSSTQILAEDDSDKSLKTNASTSTATSSKFKKKTTFRKKTPTPVAPQIFSKLTEEDENADVESDNSRTSTPSPELVDAISNVDDTNLEDDAEDNEINEEDDEDWASFTTEDNISDTKIYLFGRTDREKEDWFRRFAFATHRGAHISHNDLIDQNLEQSASDTLINNATWENEYIKYMMLFNKVPEIRYVTVVPSMPSNHTQISKRIQPDRPAKKKDQSEKQEDEISTIVEEPSNDNILWMNAFIGRILFDCFRDVNFTALVKARIERKLAAIKLPYFIEELKLTELSLGMTPPFIHRASKPVVDERGLWVDLDLTYEGLTVLTLQTKLNLMKLKQPHATDKSQTEEKSAMFHSDVDDSAESTSDDDVANFPHSNPALDSSGMPILGLGGHSNTSKKIIRMVDKLAESKLFQAATENKFIKKAMEGVSNTDLGLKVEVRELVGTLALNIPPPPSDRVWIGFRPVPELDVRAFPIVGERNITFLRVTGWIEKKIRQEFQKLLVIPNMEDLVIPVMCPKLPE